MSTRPEQQSPTPSEHPPRPADPAYDRWQGTWGRAVKRLAQEEGLSPQELAGVRSKNRKYLADKVAERRKELDALAAEIKASNLPASVRFKVEREIENLESVFERVSTYVLQGAEGATGGHAASFVEGITRSELSLKAMRDASKSSPAAPETQSDPAPDAEPAPEPEAEPVDAPAGIRADFTYIAPEGDHDFRPGHRDRVLADRAALVNVVQQVEEVQGVETPAIPTEALHDLGRRAPENDLFNTTSDVALRAGLAEQDGAFRRPNVEGFVPPSQPLEIQDTISRAERIREATAAEHATMLAEIDRHARLHKETYKKKGFWSKLMGEGRSAEGYRENQDSLRRVNEARRAYAEAKDRATREVLMEEIHVPTPEEAAAIRADHEARGLNSPELRTSITERRLRSRTPEQVEKILARHARMTRTLEVSKPFVERMNRTRIEGREESKNLFEKAIGKFQKWEQDKENKLAKFARWVSFGKLSEENAARAGKGLYRALKVLGFATVGVTVGVAAASVAGIFGLGAVAGVTAAAYVSRRLGGIALGMAGGVAAAEYYEAGAKHREGGVADRLHETTKDLAERRARGEAESSDEFLALDEAVRHGSSEAIARKKSRIEAGVAAALGAGMSIDAFYDAANVAAHTAGNADGTIDVVPYDGTDGESAGDVRLLSGESVSVGTDPSRMLEISGNINNADRLLGHFGVKMQAAYAGGEMPLSVQKLIESLSTKEGASLLLGEDKATLALGLQRDDLSAIMQPGDTISLNDQGDIVIDRPGRPELRHVLIDRDGVPHPDHKLKMDVPGAGSTPDRVTYDEPAAPDSLQDDAASTGDTAPATTESTDVERFPQEAPVEREQTPERASVPSKEPTQYWPTNNADAKAESELAPNPPAGAETMPRPELPAEPITRTIADVTESPYWEDHKGAGSWNVFNIPAAPGTPEFAFRADLFDVLRESGIGPTRTETVADYIARASDAITKQPFGEDMNVNGNTIYAGPAVYPSGNSLVVHGGDFTARSVLAAEYLRAHPDATLLVEDLEKDGIYEFTAKSIQDGEFKHPNTPPPRVATYGARVF